MFRKLVSIYFAKPLLATQSSYAHVWFSQSHHTSIIMVSPTLNAELIKGMKSAVGAVYITDSRDYGPGGDHRDIRALGLDVHEPVLGNILLAGWMYWVRQFDKVRAGRCLYPRVGYPLVPFHTPPWNVLCPWSCLS
jgi:hypothetical protein